jgi:putative intracellular protease/amidase
VCHGPAILPAIIDSKTGQSVIARKAVTGFTTEGEIVLKVLDKIKKDKVATIEEGAPKIGAKCLAPLHPFDDFSITDGHIATGANPAGAYTTAERAVKAFDMDRWAGGKPGVWCWCHAI